MLDDAELQARLAAIFRGEYEVYSLQLQSVLKALEQGQRRQDLFHEAFRTVHNLKGAAGAIGLMPIAHLAHQIETLLQTIRAGERECDQDVIDIGYAFLNQVEDWLGRSHMRWEEDQDSEVGQWITSWLSGASRAPAPSVELAPRAEPAGSEVEFVRIPLTRLEAILSEVTELMLAQHRMAHRQSDVETAFAQLQEMQKDWGRLYSLQRKAARTSEGRTSQRLLELLERQRARFRHFHSWFRGHRSQLLSDRQQLELSIDSLSDEARSLRLVPLDDLFGWLERQVRDLARRLGKSVRLEVSGRETRLDRRLVEAVRDPLMHLVRNCVDHGLESEAERQSAGKRAAGTLRLSAQQRGQSIVIEVADDGVGIDWGKVKERARALGWDTDGSQLSDLLFRPGFSTREEATSVSGRGYGLDIVEASLEAIHGRVELESHAGRGTRFTLTVPLTQATLQGLLVRCSDQTFALGIAAVERVIRLTPAMVEQVGGSLTLRLESQLLPLLSLSELLGLPRQEEQGYALVLSPGHLPVGLLVEQVLGDAELVIRGLGPVFAHLGQYAGGAVLEDGEVVLLLNPLELLRGGREGRQRFVPARPLAQSAAAKKRILVVDDSITSRTLEKSILENAGYDVVTASQGEEGLRLARTCGCQLIISDIEMPRVDGYQLARQIKSDPATQHLRVILVTSLASEEDQVRGLESGADAFVVKGQFDQARFLDLVRESLS